ncbi:MAG TPA: hypothetical protein VK470_18335 [Bacteroidota bacterium]|nr:hypothetical protein [Bacteroidota bacterium]
MKHIFSIIAVVWLAGCSLPNDTVDTPAPPFVSFAASSLTVIDVGRLVATSVDTAIVVTATARGTDVQSVTADIKAGDGSSATYLLLDNGVAPDQHKGDGLYTGYVMLQVSKSAVGAYTIQVQASDGSGLPSNIVALPVSVISSNNQPPIISQLSAPDTIFVPTSSTPNFVKLSLFVTDPDGLASIDVVQVTLYRENGTRVEASPYPLYDDGGIEKQPPFNELSGDAKAGDGFYTLTIPVPLGTNTNTYRDFVFTAKDKSGAISNSLTKRIYFK